MQRACDSEEPRDTKMAGGETEQKIKESVKIIEETGQEVENEQKTNGDRKQRKNKKKRG